MNKTIIKSNQISNSFRMLRIKTTPIKAEQDK